VPAAGPLDTYMGAVEALPMTSSPAVFGLHANAEIGYYGAATRSMWRDLLSLQPRVAGKSEGPSRESIIAQTARDISDKVSPAEAVLAVLTCRGVEHSSVHTGQQYPR
jgi:dynein heavy chain, axonemal